MIHTVKGFGIVNNAEMDVFLELSCFFDDPEDVGNLILVSSACVCIKVCYILRIVTPISYKICKYFLPLEWYSSAHLRLRIRLPAILIPAGDSYSPAFRMIYSAYKLNKQDDNIQS